MEAAIAIFPYVLMAFLVSAFSYLHFRITASTRNSNSQVA